MAIYNPPQKSNTGDTLNVIGSGLMSGAGILASTGVGAPIAGVAAGIGAIASLAGTVMSGNEQKKINEYNKNYNIVSQGQDNEAISHANIANNARQSYTQEGVSSSINAIQNFMGGTGMTNKRLT